MKVVGSSLFYLFLLLCFVIVQTQRGRIPPHAKNQPHSQHPAASGRSPASSMSSSQGKCQIVNGVNTCEPHQAKSSSFNTFLLAGALVIIGFVYMKKRQIWILKDIFKKEMTKFEEKVLQTPCKLNEKELNNRILAFQNTTFVMDDLRKDKIEHYKSEMRVVNIDKIKDRIYEIKYECRDINGEGYFQGLVGIINPTQYGIKFVKVYQKFTEMGERTKKIKNLMFYEGKGSLKTLAGEWHFLGYDDSECYSGTWKMVS